MDTKIQKPELTLFRELLSKHVQSLGTGVKKLPISQGVFAILDECDFQEAVDNGPWYCQPTEGGVYARAVIRGKPMYLQQWLMNSCHVGFINKTSLDCRRSNLFTLGRRGVMQNRTGKVDTSSNFKGVFKRKNEESWCAQIKDKIGKLWLGRHKSERQAALVYDAAAEILFGNHAYRNFVDEDMIEARAIAQKYINRRKTRKKNIAEEGLKRYLGT